MYKETRHPNHISPARPASVGSDVLVPLLQSAITSIAAGVVTTIVVITTGWSFWLTVIITLVVFVWFWLRLMTQHNEHLWIKEWYDEQEQAFPNQYITRLTVHVDNGRMIETEFPVSHDVMSKIAKGIINAGRPFSEREWAGPGRLLKSPSEFRKIRDLLLGAGLLAWRDERHNLGVQWTTEGMAALQRLASGSAIVEEVRNG